MRIKMTTIILLTLLLGALALVIRWDCATDNQREEWKKGTYNNTSMKYS